ncbi:arginine--tRNA ligase [soil metagenome]
MIREKLEKAVKEAVAKGVADGTIPATVAEVPVEISDTKQEAHGDYTCNLAMVAAKRAGANPRALAEALKNALGDANGLLTAVEIAGPGFLNLRLNPAEAGKLTADLLAKGDDLAKTQAAKPLGINVEFVSVNPNGPITIGSGRGAAFGSTLAEALRAAGNTVHREYYINDGVNSEQMRLFSESVRSYVEGSEFPENGYKGDYVKDVAETVAAMPTPPSGTETYQKVSQVLMIDRQRSDLALFGVEFDTWFSEQSLHDSGIVADRLQSLIDKGVADEGPYRTKLKLAKGGAVEEVIREDQPQDEDDSAEGTGKTLWLRSTRFGDDMDRVIRRRDGRLTYIASDVAYHEDKFNRPEGADKLITILGPDHHGYIGRLRAVLAALLQKPGESDEAALEEAKGKLDVIIYQLVRFLKDGQPAPMRKRDGNIYELRDLVREIGERAAPAAPTEEQTRIGRDVARFYYLTRSHDTALDFDLDKAVLQSDDNPVFYAQYAHARIRSVLAKADEAGFPENGPFDGALLVHPRETALIKKIADLPWEVRRVAEDYGVHRLTTYAIELARIYHHFYDVCRVVQPDQPDLTKARVALCSAAGLALRETFKLLGVSAPERM